MKDSIKDLLNKREYYRLNSLLGNDWAMFFLLIGGREAGKSYAVTECYVNQYKRYHRPFYWMRLTDTSKRKLLTNKFQQHIIRIIHQDKVSFISGLLVKNQ